MITIDLDWIELICGLIITVGGASAIVVKITKRAFKPITEPMADLQKEVQHHSECLDRDKKKLDRLDDTLYSLDKDINEIKETQGMILSSIFVMLQHMATGNNTGEMNGELKKLTAFLAQK